MWVRLLRDTQEICDMICNVKDWLKQLRSAVQKNKQLLFLLGGAVIAVLIINSIVLWYMRTEETVYYWDISGYWTPAIELTSLLHKGSLPQLLHLLGGSFQTDYNYSPLMLLLPLLNIVGVGRTAYVMSIINLYIIPAVFIGIYAFYLHHREAFTTRMAVLGCIVLLFFPALLLPALRGQVDSIGLLIIGLIFATIYKLDFSKFSYKYVLLAAELCLLVVVRRWYTYWAVTALATLGILVLVKILRETQNNRERLHAILRFSLSMIITVGIVLIVMFTCFNYLFHAYTVDYSNLYSAYKNGGFGTQILNMIYYFGGFSIIVMVLGYVAAYKSSRTPNKYIPTFFILQGLLIFILFTSTQDFAAHHYYLLFPLFAFSFLSIIMVGLSSREVRHRLLLGLLLITVAVSFLSSFIIPGKGEWRRLLFGEINHPIVREDMEALRAMAKDIEANRQAAETVYVLASSDTLNDSIVRDINLPDRFLEGIATTAHVDKRDGFPNQFFAANYVIVTSPTQTHLPQGQMVVSVLADAILRGECENLTLKKEYSLENGVTAYLYQRTAPYSDDFLQQIKIKFERVYKGNAALTSIHQ